MKRNIFLMITLIILFVFGVLIYDFSDEMDAPLANNTWYTLNNNEINILSFKDNRFTYENEKGEALKDYKTCKTYHFNKNVNVVKLNCEKEIKKLFISSYNNEELSLTEEGEEKSFYSSKEIAFIENFKQENDLTDKEYNELISINFNEELFISYSKFNELYKSKNISYIAIINNDNITYKNVYNFKVLNNLINNSTKDFYLININDLSEKEIKKLNNLTRNTNYDNKIYVYEISNKKIKLKVEIDALKETDLDNYNTI